MLSCHLFECFTSIGYSLWYKTWNKKKVLAIQTFYIYLEDTKQKYCSYVYSNFRLNHETINSWLENEQNFVYTVSRTFWGTGKIKKNSKTRKNSPPKSSGLPTHPKPNFGGIHSKWSFLSEFTCRYIRKRWLLYCWGKIHFIVFVF